MVEFPIPCDFSSPTGLGPGEEGHFWPLRFNSAPSASCAVSMVVGQGLVAQCRWEYLSEALQVGVVLADIGRSNPHHVRSFTEILP